MRSALGDDLTPHKSSVLLLGDVNTPCGVQRECYGVVQGCVRISTSGFGLGVGISTVPVGRQRGVLVNGGGLAIVCCDVQDGSTAANSSQLNKYMCSLCTSRRTSTFIPIDSV